jgi:hypothetical protein
MPKITREWIEGLNRKEFEQAVALGTYHQRTQLVFIQTDPCFHACVDMERPEKERLEILHQFFRPWYLLFASLVYVTHEGFTELNIEDKQLGRLTKKADILMLKRFRNATFHYQALVRSPKHEEYLRDVGFVAAKNLFDRQSILVRRIMRLLKYNSHFHQSP